MECVASEREGLKRRISQAVELELNGWVPGIMIEFYWNWLKRDHQPQNLKE